MLLCNDPQHPRTDVTHAPIGGAYAHTPYQIPHPERTETP
jgi:hypothetical protein